MYTMKLAWSSSHIAIYVSVTQRKPRYIHYTKFINTIWNIIFMVHNLLTCSSYMSTIWVFFLWNQFSSSPPFSPSGFTFSGSGARTGSKTCECFFMGMVMFFNLVIVWDRIACTPGWPHIHYADKTAKLLVLLPLLSKCQHYRAAQIQTRNHFVPFD